MNYRKITKAAARKRYDNGEPAPLFTWQSEAQTAPDRWTACRGFIVEGNHR